MIELDEIRPAIAELCRQLHVLRLDIFGSATDDSFSPASDVDVLVEFEMEAGDLFNRYFTLQEELSRLFQRPVDVVMVGAIRNPYFKSAVEQGCINVYTVQGEEALV